MLGGLVERDVMERTMRYVSPCQAEQGLKGVVQAVRAGDGRGDPCDVESLVAGALVPLIHVSDTATLPKSAELFPLTQPVLLRPRVGAQR